MRKENLKAWRELVGVFAFHRDKNERRDGKIFSAVEGKLEAGAECRCDCLWQCRKLEKACGRSLIFQ